MFIGDDPVRMITSVGRYYARYSISSRVFFPLSPFFLSTKNIREEMKYHSCISCTHMDIYVYACVYATLASPHRSSELLRTRSLGRTRSIFWTSDAFDSHGTRRSRMSEYRSDAHTVSDIVYERTYDSVLFVKNVSVKRGKFFQPTCTDWNYHIASRSPVKSAILFAIKKRNNLISFLNDSNWNMQLD